MKFFDAPELNTIETILRKANESLRDRQIRVKIEAYETNGLSNSPISPTNRNNSRKRDASISFTDEETDLDSAQHPKKTFLETQNNIEKKKATFWRGIHPRKTLFKQLINAMNLAFTDYDFSSVKVEQFRRVSFIQASNDVKYHFLELNSTNETITKVFLLDIWKEMNNVLSIDNSDLIEVYTYIPEIEAEIDADPLSNLGNLWTLNYLFSNVHTGRIILPACSCRPRKFSQTYDEATYPSGNNIISTQSSNSFYESWDVEEEGEEVDSSVESVFVDSYANSNKDNTTSTTSVGQSAVY